MGYFHFEKPTLARGKPSPELPRWFKEYDTDGDGQVSLYEWMQKKGTLKEFQKFDLNGDGFITVRELIRAGIYAPSKAKATAAAGPSSSPP